MVKFKLSILGVLLSLSVMHGQRMDIGLQLGGAFYDGDLALPTYMSNFKQMNVAVGFLVRAQVVPGAVLRAGVLSTSVESHDSKSDLNWQKERNLHFQSSIFEANAMLELHPFKWVTSLQKSKLSPYIFGGIGVFKFNPRAEYQGEMVDLQPLGTEGQGMPGYESRYELQSLVMPFGGGVRYTIGKWSIDLEYGLRRTNTDYLDDLSKSYVSYDELLEANGLLAAELGNKVDAPTGKKRGNDKVKDWYAVPSITVAYRFDFDNSGYIRGGKRKAMGCPTF